LKSGNGGFLKSSFHIAIVLRPAVSTAGPPLKYFLIKPIKHMKKHNRFYKDPKDGIEEGEDKVNNDAPAEGADGAAEGSEAGTQEGQ
jgi:hypothetical protein